MILTTQEKIERYTANGWWGTKTIDDYFLNLVEQTPEKIAIVDPANKASLCNSEFLTYTYTQLDDKIDQVADTLLSLGIEKDDIVAIQLPNIVELVITYFAVLRVGAIASPFPVQFREFECTQMLQSLQAKAVITLNEISEREHAKMFKALQEQVPSLQHILTYDKSDLDDVVHINLAQNVAPSEQLTRYKETQDVTANDIFTICWTSGTEGKPKGVPRSHNEWFISAYASVDAAQLNADDKILLTFPLVNMAGIGGVLVPWVLTGGTLVLHHPFDLPTFLSQIAQQQITYTLVPPSLLTMMIKNPAILGGKNISSLRSIGTGSAPITPWLIHSWKEQHGVDLINYFGSNEGATFLSDIVDVPDPKIRSLYLPRFGKKDIRWKNRIAQMIDSKIVDLDTGREILEPNRPGELKIRGAGVFSGYWNNDELNEAIFDEEGYFITGDLFEIIEENDEDRYYRVVGRVKDIIVRSGMKISPQEIEDILQTHPAVKEVALIPYPDGIHGEISCACIVPVEGQNLTLEVVNDYLREHKIASFKLPEKLVTLDQLPRNAVGKLLKAHLREVVKNEVNA